MSEITPMTPNKEDIALLSIAESRETDGMEMIPHLVA